MKKIALLIAFIPTLLFAQDKGVHFTQNLTWEQIKAKARTEHKYIMMDCYTTWCKWCKYMDKNIFPLDSVAQIANSKFINVRVQFDTSSADSKEGKNWYMLAHNFADKYSVRAYPTFLFFNSNGEIVQRAVGASLSSSAFVQVLTDAQNPQKQYYVLLRKYNNGDKDPAFLKMLALAADSLFDTKIANKVAEEYIVSQKDLYTKDNLAFVAEFTKSSKDEGFSIMLNHADKVDAVSGEGTADKMVQSIILHEDVYPVIFSAKVSKPQDLPEPDWTSIQTNLQKKYPAKADEVLAYAKVVFYEQKHDWNNFAPAVVAYMKSYGSKATSEQLNDFAWNVFLNCPDMTCVSQALDWSKKSFEGNNQPEFMDTYANILYKMGRKDEAINWEQKAMDAAAAGDKDGYRQTIDKMKNGEKTWN